MANQRDPKRTQNYIDEALQKFAGKTNPVERAQYAWAYLRAMRRLGDDPLAKSLGINVPVIAAAPFDVDLADAEHYMYARFLAGSTGDPSTRALVIGYELVKVARYALSDEKSLRTDPRFPVLPPALGAVDWGLSGVKDGLADFAQQNPGKSGTTGAAYQENKDLATGQYKNLYGYQKPASP
jgi:hypothetical protein